MFSGAASNPAEDLLVIDIPLAACTEAVLAKMAELLRSRPGTAPVLVRYQTATGLKPLTMDEVRVDAPGLIGDLAGLLGAGAARLEPSI